MHYPLEMHMVHKLFQASSTNTTIVPANASPKPFLKRAAVIGIMFGYRCAPESLCAAPPICHRRFHVADCSDVSSRSADGTDQPFIGKLVNAFKMVASSDHVQDGAFSEEFNTSTSDSATPPKTQFNLKNEIFGASAIGNTNYYNYNGSLTTPACTQGITWFVMAKPMTASPAQILAFTSALATEQGGFSRGGDNRLVQPLNGRNILASFGGPPTTVVTFAHTLNGLTVNTFTTALRTAYIATIATSLSVQASAVSIVVSDASTRRRNLLGSAVQVVTSVTVPSTVAATVTSVMAANSANPTFMAALASASGASSVSYTPPSALPAASAAASVTSAVFAAVAAVAVALAF